MMNPFKKLFKSEADKRREAAEIEFDQAMEALDRKVDEDGRDLERLQGRIHGEFDRMKKNASTTRKNVGKTIEDEAA